MKDDKIYIQHILEAIARVERYLAGFDFQAFDCSEIAQAAVVRELEIVGEAARKLSADFLASLPEVAWQDIKDMRNKLIHEYFDVDTELVWKTAREDLPQLKKALASHK
ncbi:MAG: DUF86 domain-containing protein [Candidatus Liptonbacteria bacterium]|nr:DUF86 domain-containing protein [Candidatus Liptonbacteria bacterium]